MPSDVFPIEEGQGNKRKAKGVFLFSLAQGKRRVGSLMCWDTEAIVAGTQNARDLREDTYKRGSKAKLPNWLLWVKTSTSREALGGSHIPVILKKRKQQEKWNYVSIEQSLHDAEQCKLFSNSVVVRACVWELKEDREGASGHDKRLWSAVLSFT